MSTGAGAPAASRLIWAALAVVLAVALVFSVSTQGGARTVAQRASVIDSNLKCPSCEAISVRDSSASTADAVRQVVLARVRQGQSDQQIYQYLESRYGPSILLRPPTTGITAVVWVVPVLAAAGGLGGLGLFFWRRRRPVSVRVTAEDRALVDRALAQDRRPGGDR
ncbi:MAG TPA: cytochrome c-type biogenesis protein CcmH [Acidimicrobiales bacterium]